MPLQSLFFRSFSVNTYVDILAAKFFLEHAFRFTSFTTAGVKCKLSLFVYMKGLDPAVVWVEWEGIQYPVPQM
jgi:hypothetical protein